MSTITVGNSKGGVGKSRLAIHLSYLARVEGADAVLLDTDQTGSASSWKRIRDEDEVEPAIPCFAVPANPGHELRNLSSKYDLIVVDIGANYYTTLLKCASLSDLVLVPCGDDQQETEETLQVFASLKEIGEREGRTIPAAVVLTRVTHIKDAKAIRELRDLFSSEGIVVLQHTLPYRSAWKQTGKTGRALMELKGKDRSDAASNEMRSVYEEIKTLLTWSAADWDVARQDALGQTGTGENQ